MIKPLVKPKPKPFPSRYEISNLGAIEMKKDIDQHIKDRQGKDLPITMASISLALGFSSREWTYSYAKYESFKEVIEYAKLVVENDIIERNEKNGNAMGIFRLKNINPREFKEKQEVSFNLADRYSLFEKRIEEKALIYADTGEDKEED